MVDEQESKKIKTEAEEISRELCTVFKDHLENMVRTEDKLQEIVYDLAFETLVCKANRDNPFYPEKNLFRLYCSVNQEELCLFYSGETNEKIEELKKKYYETETCKKNGSNVEDFLNFLAENNIETETISVDHEIVF